MHIFLFLDVVYDPSVIESLVKTISILIESNKLCVAYIANAIRNPLTYEQFQECLKNKCDLLNIDSIDKDLSQAIEIVRISCHS